MDRLNFRKKMAVFISLVMILQIVIGNVGFAANGSIEFDKTNLELNGDYTTDDLQEQDSKFIVENANEYKEEKDCEDDNKKGSGPIIFNLWVI